MTTFCIPYAPIPNRAALLALMPPLRRLRHPGESPGPLFAYALLAYVLERTFSLDPRTLFYTDAGKPYLPGHPVHLSLSHSNTHSLCAVAAFPIGCDIETHRPVSARLSQRILGAETASTDFFDRWTLSESHFKLCGAFDLPISPDTWHLYHDIPGCTAAVVAEESFPRPPLTILEPEVLFAYAAEK